MKRSKIALGLASIVVVGSGPIASADIVYGGDQEVRLESNQDLIISGNDDDTGGSEIVLIEVGTSSGDADSDAFISLISNANSNGDGSIEINAQAESANNSSPAEILVQPGQTTITGTLIQNGTSTLSGTTNLSGGSTNISGGITTITGVTNVNTTGSNQTTIGNLSAVVGVNGSTVTRTAATSITDTSETITLTTGTSRFAATDVQAQLSSGSGASFTSYSSGTAVGAGGYAMANGNLASRAIVTNALGTAGTVDNVIVGDTLVDGNMYINGTLSYSSNTSAETVVTGSNTVGEMTIANTGGASVDANGALSTSGATGATASLTLTNSQNNTHGMVVTESQTTISGGTTSSSLTLDDRGATFSDSSTGAPVQVHGVDDGTADFDAVNVRQFGGAIAATAAMAQIPELDSNATGNLGIGVASFMGYQGLAVATQVRVNERTVIRGGVSSNLEGKARPIIGVGAAFSW